MIFLSTNELIREQSTQTDVTVHTTNSSVQTDRSVEAKEPGTAPSRVFGVTMIQGSDSATKFNTGLRTWSIFLYVFMFLLPFVSHGRCLAFDNEFFLALVKLQLNLFALDLASRFGICWISSSHLSEMVRCYVRSCTVSHHLAFSWSITAEHATSFLAALSKHHRLFGNIHWNPYKFQRSSWNILKL